RELGLTPYAAAEAIGYSASGYSEGFTAPATGIFALSYGAKTTGTLRTELGLRIDSLTPLAPGADLLTFGRLAYG
ncbi:autotransporter domain-containing protein, partial [Acinetobacter baumannii]|uniref:autotransporter domain-containing protein n=1 Tax=Acinetobacter baumannii TaxID=470 RepID=UPI0013D594D8